MTVEAVAQVSNFLQWQNTKLPVRVKKLQHQCAKEVVFNAPPGLVNFAIWPTNSFLNLRCRQVKFLGVLKLQTCCKTKINLDGQKAFFKVI